MPDFYSYGRTMHITFKSEAFMTGNGFSLTYQLAGESFPMNLKGVNILVFLVRLYCHVCICLYVIYLQVAVGFMNRNTVTLRAQAGLIYILIILNAASYCRPLRTAPSLCSLPVLMWRIILPATLTT